MCLRVNYIEKYEIFFASLKSLKNGVGSAAVSRSGSISQRYGTADMKIRIRTKMSQIPNTTEEKLINNVSEKIEPPKKA
jgi:hypothetical protein